MKQEQRKRIIDRHRDSLTRHGHSPHALYWSSREIQFARFRVLAEIGIESGDSVLDVGCGFGDLYGWLKRQDIDTDFTGIDLSPDLIARGEQLYPRAHFFSGELFDYPAEAQSVDWVVLSGALNGSLEDEGAYARRVIRQMFVLCRKGVAFNLLNANHPSVNWAHDLQCFDPDEMLAFCSEIAPECSVRTDYLDNDFTIYMYRTAEAG
jgi:SAM-dependent methyltransferase